MKLAVFADLHLDALFRWAGHDLARRRRQQLREALTRIVDRAEEAGVDAVLCAGDLFEQEYVTPDTERFLRDAFARVDPVPVFVAPGNHDWLGPASPWARIDWSPNVHVFREAELRPVELAEGITLWGAAHRAPANTDGFLSSFRVDRPGVNLALFHGSERGGFPHQGEGKQPHAPFDAQEIERAGLDHAFVGHHHRPRDAERHTYPGNPEPLTFGEDERAGLVLAEVDGAGNVRRERVDVHVCSMGEVRVDLSGIGHGSEARERVREAVAGLAGIVRVVLEGEVGEELDLALADIEDLGDGALVVVPQVGRITVAYDVGRIADEGTVRGEFVRQVTAAEDLDETLRRKVIVTGLRALAGRSDLEVP
ncbi:MAG TPA: metallophosphoesterase [Longimicrobiales bacterium]|nr:metallophosphoesterase [Longimicrobiales bacterium]